jgi:hypothetical protein
MLTIQKSCIFTALQWQRDGLCKVRAEYRTGKRDDILNPDDRTFEMTNNLEVTQLGKPKHPPPLSSRELFNYSLYCFSHHGESSRS